MFEDANLDIRNFADAFFSDLTFADKYKQRIRDTLADGKSRLIVNINDLRSYNGETAAKIIKQPRDYMVAFKEVADELIKTDTDLLTAKLAPRDGINIGFEGSFGTNFVSPRGLIASKLNSLVEVEGIVTKCSSVKPKLARLVQYSEIKKSYSEKLYRDISTIGIGAMTKGGNLALPTNSVIPSVDVDGNPVSIEHGWSVYEDHQTVIIQEMPERAKVGQLPRSIEVILQHDLVDRVKPGDRVTCAGIYRPVAAPVLKGNCSGIFKSNLIACNISIIGQEIGAIILTAQDVKNIRKLSSRPSVLDTLSRSLCPSIFGHDFVKKALILQLLGGCEKNLDNGTHLRGDVNVMLVGDPSTAKSQLLRAVLDIAPLAISTTGRGSSGVGLTAAVTSDGESRERRLEAGAMVLADRGIVCIDEFDKMGENDRVAIHEVMEQQTVTIAKAGIHASLNARCSVLAAANPVYGQYDRQRSPQANIGLPDSLLSRFDLLFIVLDSMDPAFDRVLSEHVIRSHQYRKPGTTMEPEPLNQDSSVNLEEAADVAAETAVWQRGGRGSDTSFGDGREGDVLTKDFLKKYIHYAKRLTPELSDDAMEQIADEYARMRSKQTKRNLPITARSLETLIRLSTASAKSRLSTSVEDEDVTVAVDLLNFVLFHDISSSNEASAADVDNQSGNKRKRDDEESRIHEVSLESDIAQLTDDIGIYNRILNILSDLQSSGDTSLEVTTLVDRLTVQLQVAPDIGDVTHVLQALENSNKIMLTEGTLFLV